MTSVLAVGLAEFDLTAPLLKISTQITEGGIAVLVVVGTMKAFSIAKRMLRGA